MKIKANGIEMHYEFSGNGLGAVLRYDSLGHGGSGGQIAGAIPGARLEIIPNAAHLSNIERAEGFNRLLLDFLA